MRSSHGRVLAGIGGAVALVGCQVIVGLPVDIVVETTTTMGTGGLGGTSVSGTTGAGGLGGASATSTTGTGGGCMNGTCLATSCQESGPGLSNCGPSGTESCCASPLVDGASYNRALAGIKYPATVSDFRLDRFEITVGRFRRFLAGYPMNQPVEGAGAHASTPGSGWDKSLTKYLPATREDLKLVVKCSSEATWTDESGANEELPMNCMSWYEAFAFCAWDGGRLPTEAEWNYAAARGSEERQYPWGNGLPDPTYAVYDCTGDGSPSQQCAFADILKVGSRSPKGDGKWLQADLAGSVFEWTLDFWSDTYPLMCNDCANTTAPGVDFGVIRGGGWSSTPNGDLRSFTRVKDGDDVHHQAIGARCARDP